MDNTAIATRALESGESTSEHAVMQSASLWGKVYAMGGAAIAALPALQDLLTNSPVGETVSQTRWGGIALACLGGLIPVLGIVKETKAKVEYIQGRSLIKAAAIRDVNAGDAPAVAVDAPKL